MTTGIRSAKWEGASNGFAFSAASKSCRIALAP
jgi:hypothetical protein